MTTGSSLGADGAQGNAPGAPGALPSWTSSAKTGVGTAINPGSRVWFTLSDGVITEVYYPRVDQICLRDMTMVVTDGQSFFSHEQQDTEHAIDWLAEDVPAYRLLNTCSQGRYRLEKQIVVDTERDTLLQQVRLVPLSGDLSDYHLFVLANPHIANQGAGNTAWLDDYKGTPMLFASRGPNVVAVACSAGWRRRSAGFVGVSDGWQDLSAHRLLTNSYARADAGNVSLTGEVDLEACDGDFVLAAGFGQTAAEAGQRSLASLLADFDATKATYISEWQDWQRGVDPRRPADPALAGVYSKSVWVLHTHEAKHIPGGMIASLSVPWGFARGDDLGGYHLVWPRDLAEAAGALLACGLREDANRVIHYLQATQEADGHWPQNMWLDGSSYWLGLQMDETAFPILLVALADREGALVDGDLKRLWPMVRRAAGFLVRNGPVTQEDRWEEDPGYAPFTLAVEVAALLVAAGMAAAHSEPDVAEYLLQTADLWNAGIERWTYVTDTDVARAYGVDGYYVRIAPPNRPEAAAKDMGFVLIKNRPPGQDRTPAECIVSPDALALVRFGLRSADDPRIVNTVRVIDALLKVETPFGPAWRRYNEDGYGEKDDGSPFDGTGIGRAWPLLSGERAHYELAAGRADEARRLCKTLAAFANEGSMIPEQVWDRDDIPMHHLQLGRPSGSAMPLVWAHAEFLKLWHSLCDGAVFDLPQQAAQRYVVEKHGSPFGMWKFNHKCRSLPAGKALRIETLAPAMVHWSSDNWHTVQDTATRDSGLGTHVADLPTSHLPSGASIQFSFFWPEAGTWENRNFSVFVG